MQITITKATSPEIKGVELNSLGAGSGFGAGGFGFGAGGTYLVILCEVSKSGVGA